MEEDNEAPVATEAVEENPVESKPEEPVTNENPPEEKRTPKPKGHWRKDPNTEVLTERTSCEDCNQTISKHTKRYTRRCPAKKAQVTVESIQPIQEIEETPASSSNEPAPRARKQPAQPPRRLLDLDTIDHNRPDVHYVVSKYMSSMSETMHQQKVDRYRSLLSGKFESRFKYTGHCRVSLA